VILPHTQRSWIGKAHIVGQSIVPTYYRPGTLHEDNGTTHSRPYRRRAHRSTQSGTNDSSNQQYDDTNNDENDDDVEEWILISSTPASCVQLGLHHFFQSRPTVDLVVSGPNYGRNTTAVFALSSGTLGGALEAAVCGVRSIALSYAFFDRENRPAVIREASEHAVRVVERLAADGKYWADWEAEEGVSSREFGGLLAPHVYSVNVPLREGVSKEKVLWTEMLQNRWTGGSCFQEVAVPEGEDEGPEEIEEEIRDQEADGNVEGKLERKHVRHVHQHYRWAPKFKDVYQSVERSKPGNDGWAVREGYTR
jgi:tubulin---tyrosine ligase